MRSCAGTESGFDRPDSVLPVATPANCGTWESRRHGIGASADRRWDARHAPSLPGSGLMPVVAGRIRGGALQSDRRPASSARSAVAGPSAAASRGCRAVAREAALASAIMVTWSPGTEITGHGTPYPGDAQFDAVARRNKGSAGRSVTAPAGGPGRSCGWWSAAAHRGMPPRREPSPPPAAAADTSESARRCVQRRGPDRPLLGRHHRRTQYRRLLRLDGVGADDIEQAGGDDVHAQRRNKSAQWSTVSR